MTLPALVRQRIESLALAPHPEGGFYREIFRSTEQVTPADGRGARCALTVIHFLLPAGAHSRWHEVRADEQWAHLEGAPLELFVIERDASAVQRVRLGPLTENCAPTHVVPAGAWQAARAVERYTLVTCTVAPGFEFADFRMVADVAGARERIASLDRELLALL